MQSITVAFKEIPGANKYPALKVNQIRKGMMLINKIKAVPNVNVYNQLPVKYFEAKV